jgi:hypothetical protein
VLVHCQEGISRSSTIVIAYLMRTYGLSLHHAYTYTKGQRKQVFPNLGFWKQLARFEEELHNTAAGTTGPFRETLSDCIDVKLLTEEYKARKAAAGGGDCSSASSDTLDADLPTTCPPGASPNGTWSLQGVASADAKSRAEEAVVEEAQTPCGPIVTAE